MPAQISDLHKSFARHLRAEGKADRTIQTYGWSIDYFCDWLETQGRPADLDNLTKPAIREWLATLTDAGRQPNTVKTRFRGLYRFCRWLVSEEELAANPMTGIAPPVPPPKPVPILNDQELEALVKTCQSKSFVDRRDEAMIRLFFDCGPRVSEMSSIQTEEVDLDSEVIPILGKGSKIRLLYPSTRTIRALDRYIRTRRDHRLSGLSPLFLSQRGGMTPDGIRERLTVRARQAGLEVRLHPHRFRHTWAHDFLMEGGQERDLKRLAGWTSDAMLSIYGASAADARARAAAKRMQRGDRI